MTERSTSEHRLTLEVGTTEVKAIHHNGERGRGTVQYERGSLLRDMINALREWLENDWRPLDSNNPSDRLKLTVLRDEKGFELLGRCLYEVLFGGAGNEARTSLRRAWEAAREQHVPLRVVLNFTDAPELANLPWEYLWFEDVEDFICRHVDMVLTRYIEQGTPHPRLRTSQLKILVAHTRPNSLPSVEEHLTINSIQDYINKLKTSVIPINESFTRLELVAPETSMAFEEFEEQLERENPHILHFIGHGEFDAHRKEGRIAFINPDDPNDKELISDVKFARACRKASNLRLVILQICEGGAVSFVDGNDGFVPRLMQSAAVPAVVAMQHPVHYVAAADFMDTFYRELLKTNDVGWAVQKGREALSGSLSMRRRDGKSIYAFGTPVLYLRSDDGMLLDLKSPTDEPTRTVPGHGSHVTLIATQPPVRDAHIESNSIDEHFSHARKRVDQLDNLAPSQKLDLRDELRRIKKNLTDPKPTVIRQQIADEAEAIKARIDDMPHFDDLYEILRDMEDSL